MMSVSLLLSAFLAVVAQPADKSTFGTLPTPAHLDYHTREIIAIVHWGPNTYTGQEWGFGNVSPSRVTPDNLDPAQWVEAMAAGGIQGVILVCKHHDGFCLWPSPLNKEYSMSAVPGKYQGFDVVKATEQACRAKGLTFGAYLSPWDRYQANYATPAYVEYFHKQWDELMTQYGDICEIWLDGANGGTGWYGGVNGGKGERRSLSEDYYQKPRLLARLHELHPKAVAFGGHHNWSVKWCGNERGTSPETWWNPSKGDDGLEYWQPSEADTPFRGGWFFHAHEKPKPLKRLVDMYFESVGRGAVLNLGIAPDKHGQVCAEDVKRLKEFGDYVRAFNAVDLAKNLPKPTTFNCVDIREKIELGQRVKSFEVEAKIDGQWQKIAAGTTIGARRLVRFPMVTATGVRIKTMVKDGAGAARLHPFALRVAPVVADGGEVLPADLLPSKDWQVLTQSESMRAVDCGKEVTLKGFDFVPRENFKYPLKNTYTFAISKDGKTWKTVQSGEIGNLSANPVRNRITFPRKVKARYFKFTGIPVKDVQPF